MSIIDSISTIRSDLTTIENLFDKTTYTVPNYQRTYNWKIEQVDDYTESIEEMIYYNLENKHGEISNAIYYNHLGSVILIPKTDDYNFDIVDGQQRLITFTLTLIALRQSSINLLSKNSNGTIDDDDFYRISAIPDHIRNLITKKNNYTKQTLGYRMNLSEQYEQDKFQQLIAQKADLENIKKNNHLFLNYNRIVEWIDKLIDSDEFKNYLPMEYSRLEYLYDLFLNNTVVFKTSIKKMRDAFSLFEAINTTGLHLTNFDLLNGKINSELKTTYLKTWSSKVSSYRNKSEIKLDEYLFFWWQSRGYNTGQSDLFDEISKSIRGVVEDYAKDIISSFDFLYDYLNDSSYEAIYISLLKRKKIIPLILALFRHGVAINVINEITSFLIKYSFIELNIYEHSPGIFQYRLREILNLINDKQNSITLSDIIKDQNVLSDFTQY